MTLEEKHKGHSIRIWESKDWLVSLGDKLEVRDGFNGQFDDQTALYCEDCGEDINHDEAGYKEFNTKIQEAVITSYNN